jgi:ABC-2 type transport system ATP-binding protein
MKFRERPLRQPDSIPLSGAREVPALPTSCFHLFAFCCPSLSSYQAVIEVENLTRVFRTYKKQPGFWGGVRGLIHRTFEETRAVDNVSFSIPEGSFVGFLGPNGAGKTTCLKMLSGLIHPTSGKATVAGFEPARRSNDYRRIFSLVLGQKNQLWWDLPARESFLLLRHIYSIPKDAFNQRVDELTELLGVTHKLDVMVRELSLGERMKMELIAALLHRPRVLFLDEPTIGLDVVSQRAIRQFLREYNRRHNVTILLTSHYMADIEELCERVIVINKGRMLYDGSLSRLHTAGGPRKIIRFRPADGRWPDSWSHPGRRIEAPAGSVALEIPAENVQQVCSSIFATAPVADITVEDVPFEDVIHELFKA